MKEFLLNFDNFVDKNLIQGIFVGFFFLFITYIPFVRNLFSLIWPALRYVKALLIGKKYVLIWNDDSIGVSENIAELLKVECSKFRYKELKTAEQMLRYPMSPKTMQIVILIVTDVTKLSEIEKCRDKIQTKLSAYVRAGGTIFGTHDIIYRRCRNKHLQELFGCELCNFQRVKEPVSVKIEQNYADHPLLTGLPTEFEFDDGEICWGDWSKDTKVLIKTVKKFHNHIKDRLENVPTLAVRHTGKIGTMIWLNAADKADKIAASLSDPETNVIKLMANAIIYNEEIRQYYRTHHH